MSEENVEVVRLAVDAMNRADGTAFTDYLHPDVVWEENSDAFPGLKGVYRGRAEARRWFEEALLEVWESFHLEVEEVIDATDARVVAELSFTARGAQSGVESGFRFWPLLWFAEGKVIRRVVYWTRDEALEAAGLSK